MMTLALLITAATGAWAQDAYEQFTTADRNGTQLVFTGEHFKITGTKIDDYGMYVQSDCPVTISALNGETITKVEMTIYYLYSWSTTHTIVSTPDATIDGAYSTGQTFTITPTGANVSEVTLSANVEIDMAQLQVIEWKVYYTNASGTPVPLTWDAATPKTATLTNGMPAGNVTVSVEYFPQAEFAMSTDATPIALAPTAIANVPANTDAPIVKAGTVANIGTSEVPQGTLMYYVSQPTGNTVPDAPDYDDKGWSEKVPTADGLKQGKAFVWYYIKGAEPANIADRTDDNTRSDSDIKPLGTNGVVTLLPEPTYDVSLNQTGMADGEPAKWSAKSTNVTTAVNLGEADLEGVKKGETVTVTYSGTKKIIGVKAEKKAKAAVGHALSASVVGEIVGSDGKAYAADDKDNLPEGVTAVAIIAYVGSATGELSPYTHGLAIAMKDAAAGGSVKWSSSRNDESLTNYTEESPAVTTAQSGLSNSQTSGFDDVSNYPAFYAALHNTITVSDGISAAAPASVTSGWFLPSLYQWNMIVKGLSGQSADLSYSDNNDLTVSSLNTKIEAAGGTGLQSDRYWSSTEYDINSALGFGASFGGVMYYFKDTNRYVRSAFAF